MVSVGKEYRQTLFSAQYVKKGVRGDLSRVADGFRCRRCDGTIQEVDLAEDLMVGAPNDTAYKWWSCQSGPTLLCKLRRTFPPPAMGARFTVFWSMPVMRTWWVPGAAAHKSR